MNKVGTSRVADRTYEIDRHQASKLLKVSTRTVDRYLQGGQLTAVKTRGRVMLSKEEVITLKKGIPYTAQPEKAATKREITSRPRDNAFYKDLYDETLKVLEEKDSRLQQMQYRIGQLESKMPLPSSTEFQAAEFQSLKILRDNLADTERTMRHLETRLKREKLNRTVITGILYILLLLQPILWYFLRNGFQY